MLCFGSCRHQIFGCRAKCLLTVGVLFAVIFLTLIQKEKHLTSIIDLELPKCPACYGTTLCTDIINGQFHLLGWNHWRFLHVLNQKNVYYAKYKDSHQVVMKKLAHDWELQQFDMWLCQQIFQTPDCDVGQAAAILSRQNNTHRLSATLAYTNVFLQCPSISLLNKMKSVFQKNELLSNKHANVMTMLHLNPEPLIIQTFPYEEGWPFPKYLGACGRVVVESYVGPSLTSFTNAHWKTRLRLAHKISQLAEKLTNNPTRYCLYMTDLTFSNFAVSSKEEVALVDVEHLVIVECRPQDAAVSQDQMPRANAKRMQLHANHMKGNEQHLIFSVDELCSNNMADHNYYAVCQGIMSSNPWSNEINGGLLHDIPLEIDRRWNISQLVNECCRPSTYLGRFTVFSQLQTVLLHASLDDI